MTPNSCSVAASMTTVTGLKPPGLTGLEDSLFLTAAATLLSPPAMALWTSHGSFTQR